jgi:hypothetical protein
MGFLRSAGRAHYAPGRERPKAWSSREPGCRWQLSHCRPAEPLSHRWRHGKATRWQRHLARSLHSGPCTLAPALWPLHLAPALSPCTWPGHLAHALGLGAWPGRLAWALGLGAWPGRLGSIAQALIALWRLAAPRSGAIALTSRALPRPLMKARWLHVGARRGLDCPWQGWAKLGPGCGCQATLARNRWPESSSTSIWSPGATASRPGAAARPPKSRGSTRSGPAHGSARAL